MQNQYSGRVRETINIENKYLESYIDAQRRDFLEINLDIESTRSQ